MDTWDAEWQERQQQMDAVEHAGKYAEMVKMDDEAVNEAVSKASDWAWDAAKPVINECAKSMAKAIVAELTEAPTDALDTVANRLGVEVDDELLTKRMLGRRPGIWLTPYPTRFMRRYSRRWAGTNDLPNPALAAAFPGIPPRQIARRLQLAVAP